TTALRSPRLNSRKQASATQTRSAKKRSRFIPSNGNTVRPIISFTILFTVASRPQFRSKPNFTTVSLRRNWNGNTRPAASNRTSTSSKSRKQFQVFGQLEPWTGGIHSAGSLFIKRDPSYKFSGNVLGHEIVHLVLHRFYTDGIPCWLNEGFAQFISK